MSENKLTQEAEDFCKRPEAGRAGPDVLAVQANAHGSPQGCPVCGRFLTCR
jgi:hypothetical protein